MSKFRLIDFIKKISIILLVILITNGPLIAFARPGGGGGGGSSGGGGGGSSSGGSSSSYHGGSSRYNRGNDNPIAFILNLGVFAIISSAGAIILKVRLSKKKVKSVKAIKSLSEKDANWDYRYIKKDIEEAFYKVGVAWMERNQDLAKEYISEKLYNKHRMQNEWMIVRNEKNILKNMKLLGAKPIGVIDKVGTNKDCIWVHIKAKSIDYTINDETNEVIEGSPYKSVYYEEYWKFIKSEYRWILDEIRQIDDVDNVDFFGIQVDDEKLN